MTLSARIKGKLLPHVSSFVSFNVIQATQLFLPMLVLPWLARSLGPEAYGLCLYLGVITGIVGIVMDWGFPLGATRDVAVNRGREKELCDIFSGVLSAKVLLACCCALSCLFLSPLVPHALDYPGAYALAVLAGIARGVSPIWFFQGLGQGIQRVACWDAASSVLALALTIACVREPSDWPLYLLLLGLAKGGAYLALTLQQLRLHSPASFNPRRGWLTLVRHKTFFVGNLATLIYLRGTQLILGFFLPPAQMGMLVTADKIVRATVSLNYPLLQTMFPEICIMRKADGNRATRLLRLFFFGAAALMILGAGLLWLLAPWLIDVVLGAAYSEIIPVLRIMCFFIPLQTCNDVLAGQVLTPLGGERFQTLVKAAVALVSLPAAAALGAWHGINGGACLPILLQGGMLLGLVLSTARICPELFVPGGEK
ncbi:MAG: oligosaccharide flippase family protein [Desulfovibrio sp.]|nr:oligosaccharide flippase family protein [Desulfovibrio sp.]